MTILHTMMNKEECDYSMIDEIVKIDVLSDFSDEEIRTAVNELTKRGFLFEIEKPYGCVYGINKLRIANCYSIYTKTSLAFIGVAYVFPTDQSINFFTNFGVITSGISNGNRYLFQTPPVLFV